jgi:hypothetical protein
MQCRNFFLSASDLLFLFMVSILNRRYFPFLPPRPWKCQPKIAHFMRICRKFDKKANSPIGELILGDHGEKSKNTAKLVWSLAALSPKRSEIDAGGSSQSDGHPTYHSDNLGENWRFARTRGDFSTGKSLSNFDPEASSH